MIVAIACAATPVPRAVVLRTVEVARVGHPTAIVEPARGPAGLYVTEQDGRVWRVHGGETTTVLDVREKVEAGGEAGLLGLAFSPSYPEDPRVYVNYTYDDRGDLRTRIASFRMSADGARLDPASEVDVLSFEQPWSNHNSGSLAFGPDGMLYAGVGDGGAGGDPKGAGQDLGDWLGSILRLDVSVAPYRVPADNPFVGKAGAKPEIWAYGLRNPWGMHFDGDTLWFADVGQDRWEEVNRGQAGGNYGWNVMEGRHCFRGIACDASAFVAPEAEYGHDEGRSVTGGLVYRGPSIPAIDGRYVYADFATGTAWALDPSSGDVRNLGPIGRPSCFGQDRERNLYVGDYGGRILRVVP